MTEFVNNITGEKDSDDDDDIDPLDDIIDYLVRCAKISFKTSHVDEKEIRTSENIRLAHKSYQESPINFLLKYGKRMAPQHINYFEMLKPFEHENEDCEYRKCIAELKHYHSDECRRIRVRNRRFKALQKLESETEYFSEKQMMYRNPLLYDQLIGQFLSDEEIRERDSADDENLTLLNMILETVDRNHMRETKEEQELSENLESVLLEPKSPHEEAPRARWGEFDEPESVSEREKWKPPVRKQAIISIPEKQLFREEFFQEMYSSFIEGRDICVDYSLIDDNEEYDDLQQVSQDAEDEYFDSESNEVENLEQHMKLTESYLHERRDSTDDPLDEFMTHLNKLLNRLWLNYLNL